MRFPVLLASLLATGCWMTPAEYAADADREVGAIVEQTDRSVLGGRREWVVQPQEVVPQPAPPAALSVDLPRAVAIAVTTSRDFVRRKEDVTLRGLDTSLQRYNFGPLFSSTIGYLWNDAEDVPSTSSLGGTLGVTQVLDTGATVGLGALLSRSRLPSGDSEWVSDVSFDITQPLLRGAGYESSHESLTQAERDLVYEVRDFELFRQQFSIDVAESYYDLVSRLKRIVNLEQNYQNALFDRNKSDALRQVDRIQDEDVFLARRRFIDADNDLLVAQTDYRRALDDFKIQLGLPADVGLEIADVEPPFDPLTLDEDAAVSVALHNRLDLLTVTDRLKDAERQARIAENGLLPDLGVGLGVGRGDIDDSLSGLGPGDFNVSASLALDLPLQRQAERNAYRSAQIEVDRARREVSLQEDGVDRDVRNQMRRIRQVEKQIELTNQQILQSMRAVAVTEIRYESGDSDSRDLIEARSALVDAENDLINLQASHFIARLRLLAALGLLFLDEQGMWQA